MIRDFTYVTTLLKALNLLDKPPLKIPTSIQNIQIHLSWAPHRIFNIGNSSPIPLLEYINEIEIALDKKAIKEMKQCNQEMFSYQCRYIFIRKMG